MILVAGGTGTLGRQVVARLVSSGHQVRVLTRVAAHAAGLGAQVSIGDVRDPSSLAAASTGCETVVAATHGFLGGRGGGPEAIDNHGNANLIRAAVDAEVSHFVLLSVLGASAAHPLSLHRAKHAAEQHLYNSGLSWTVLRPSAYVETWTGVIGAPLADGGPALVFGHGDNPINFIAASDVAALVERAITDESLRCETIDVPGPDNLTMTEFARLLGARRIKRIPRGALRAMSIAAAPVAPAFARRAATALVMDTTDMTADAHSLCARFPDLSWRSASDVLRSREA
ncbi:SDR family oxidoreductase [Jatrophihabitans telluris]|uniref:SDR family oxidoreductase n=1 Tax=Jatrophihabitans telluris TaxID=2038343 RepID=A0ABY4QVC8_9ACTN|nr:SDR family oxidoreductase [Jatrophihabitans telluris]UQX87445.1 SDR family oxidoreductase [Jatrophihabitans telluris]